MRIREEYSSGVPGLATGEGFDSGALASFTASDGADSVRTDRGRHNKCLHVMNHKGIECVVGAFHDRFFPGNEIQYVDAAKALPAGMVWHGAAEPMASSLDELGFVQSCALFAPALCVRNGTDPVDQPLPRVIFIPLPADIGLAMLDVDGAR